MKNLKIIILLIFASCTYSNKQTGQTGVVLENGCNERFSFIKSPLTSDNFFTQSDIKKRNMLLPDSIKNHFEDTDILNQIKDNKWYVFDIVNVRDNIHSICLSLEGLANDDVYILNIDCDYQLVDYLRFEDCNYFDAFRLPNQNSEKAIYLLKYFKFSNDTIFLSSHVRKMEILQLE